jgi:hypothetical protein
LSNGKKWVSAATVKEDNQKRYQVVWRLDAVEEGRDNFSADVGRMLEKLKQQFMAQSSNALVRVTQAGKELDFKIETLYNPCKCL